MPGTGVLSEMLCSRQLQAIPLAAMPQEQAFRGTNLNDVCARVTNAKWFSQDCDVVLRLSDFCLSFRWLGHRGVFFCLAAMLRGRVTECVEN